MQHSPDAFQHQLEIVLTSHPCTPVHIPSCLQAICGLFFPKCSCSPIHEWARMEATLCHTQKIKGFWLAQISANVCCERGQSWDWWGSSRWFCGGSTWDCSRSFDSPHMCMPAREWVSAQHINLNCPSFSPWRNPLSPTTQSFLRFCFASSGMKVWSSPEMYPPAWQPRAFRRR